MPFFSQVRSAACYQNRKILVNSDIENKNHGNRIVLLSSVLWRKMGMSVKGWDATAVSYWDGMLQISFKRCQWQLHRCQS